MQTPTPFHENRPWGTELWLTRDMSDRPAMVKILTVNPHESLSLQYHHHRDEFWHVISGDGIAELGETAESMSAQKLAANQDLFVPRETHHRLIGGTEPLVILELAFGDFDETDIVRLEDKYGRTDKPL